VSRRKRQASRGAAPTGRGQTPSPAGRSGTRPPRSPATPLGPRLLADVAILAGVVAAVTVIAELAGAANLGVSLGIATIAFTLVLMYLMLER
jgi:hypothetical protein